MRRNQPSLGILLFTLAACGAASGSDGSDGAYVPQIECECIDCPNSGQTIWAKDLIPSGSMNGVAASVAVDELGRPAIAAQFDSVPQIELRDRDGSPLWTWKGEADDRFRELARTSDGDVVAGGTRGSSGSQGIAIQLDPEGGVVWEWEVAAEVGGSNVNGVAVAADDQVILVGPLLDSGEMFVRSVDPEWQVIVGADHNLIPTGVAADADEIVVVGLFEQNTSRVDLWIERFTLDGERRDPVDVGQFPGDLRSIVDVAIDDAGAILVAGSRETPQNIVQPWLGKLSPDGELIWDRTMTDPPLRATTFVAVDHDANVFWGGGWVIDPGWLAKQGPDSERLWVKTGEDLDLGEAAIYAGDVDPCGELYTIVSDPGLPPISPGTSMLRKVRG